MNSEDLLALLASAGGFDWDEGNAKKNLTHGVEQFEIEQVFFNPPIVVLSDTQHSSNEGRWKLFGKTSAGRPLLVVFALRRKLIRPISARPMSKKETRFYEKEA